jgi:DNA anti-recombination protein RmuC
MMTMRTVALIWQYQGQKEKAHEIANLASRLCNKFIASTDDLNAVRTKIIEALGTHDVAMKRLFSGQGNALSILNRIRQQKVDMNVIPSVATGDGPLAYGEDQDAIEECNTIIVPPEASQDEPMAGTPSSQ